MKRFFGLFVASFIIGSGVLASALFGARVFGTKETNPVVRADAAGTFLPDADYYDSTTGTYVPPIELYYSDTPAALGYGGLAERKLNTTGENSNFVYERGTWFMGLKEYSNVSAAPFHYGSPVGTNARILVVLRDQDLKFGKFCEDFDGELTTETVYSPETSGDIANPAVRSISWARLAVQNNIVRKNQPQEGGGVADENVHGEIKSLTTESNASNVPGEATNLFNAVNTPNGNGHRTGTIKVNTLEMYGATYYDVSFKTENINSHVETVYSFRIVSRYRTPQFAVTVYGGDINDPSTAHFATTSGTEDSLVTIAWEPDKLGGASVKSYDLQNISVIPGTIPEFFQNAVWGNNKRQLIFKRNPDVPLVDGTYEIMFRIAYRWDKLTYAQTLIAESPETGFEARKPSIDQVDTAILTATIVFETPAPDAFPYWIVLACIGALGAFGGGMVLINKFINAAHIGDMHRRMRAEERARRENYDRSVAEPETV
jgi:hypothetical protein